MAGKIRTKEKCPHCNQPFESVLHPLTKDQLDLMCPVHKTRPRFFFIEARTMGAGRIYKDSRGQLFDSFQAAHRQLEEMRAEIDNRTFDPDDWMPSKLKEFKFENEARKWLERLAVDKSHSYIRHSQTYMEKHIIPELEGVDVRDIRRSHVNDLYYELRDKGLAPKTIKGILGTLQTFLNGLYEAEVIRRVPKNMHVRVPQKVRGWINRERQAQVLSLIPERHRLIFETLVETAERPGEVCAHKKKDLIDGEIAIERAFDEKGSLKETKSGRVIYRGLSLGLWQKLTDHSKDQLPEAWLFMDKGQPYSRDKLYRIWKMACKMAGVKISLYAGTRHSRASQKRLEMEKQVAEACRDALGHTDSRVTMEHYARDRREEIESL